MHLSSICICICFMHPFKEALCCQEHGVPGPRVISGIQFSTSSKPKLSITCHSSSWNVIAQSNYFHCNSFFMVRPFSQAVFFVYRSFYRTFLTCNFGCLDLVLLRFDALKIKFASSFHETILHRKARIIVRNAHRKFCTDMCW